MKLLLLLPLLCYSFISFEQSYPFTKNFVAGVIMLKDSSQRSGQIKWFADQNEKLKFRENDNADTKKYAPGDLIGFAADTLRFRSLFNFEAYSSDFALLGKTTKIKECFGQLIDSGEFNIYLVFISGYNAFAGGIETDLNFVFERKIDSVNQYAAYPFAMRMKDKRYESAKEDLYIFFKDYPAIIDKIKTYKQQDDFLAIINLMKSLN
jgi:hypothetical protein